MLVAAVTDGGGGGGEAARRLIVVVGVEAQLTAVHVLHALVRARRVGRVRRGDLRWEMRDGVKFEVCLEWYVHTLVFIA